MVSMGPRRYSEQAKGSSSVGGMDMDENLSVPVRKGAKVVVGYPTTGPNDRRSKSGALLADFNAYGSR